MGLVDVVVPAGRPSVDGRPDDRAQRTRATAALVLLGLALWCGSYLVAMMMPAFYGVDEPAHLGYVASLLRGDLPQIEDPLPKGELALLDRLVERYEARGGGPNGRDVVWVANHPPTYYVLATPAVVLGAALDDDNGALLGMRAVSAALVALTVVAVGALAGRLAPGRPAVAVGAAALFALTAELPQIGSHAYSDPLALLMWVVGLTVAVEVLRRPAADLDRRLVWVAAAVGATCGLTRASLLPMTGTIVMAWVVATALAWRQARPWRVAALGAAASAIVPLVVAGPWYLRNRQLYGTLTGDQFLFERFHRTAHGTPIDQLTSGSFWRSIVLSTWERGRGLVEVDNARWVVAAIAVAALLLGGLRWLRTGRSVSVPGVIGWVAAAGSSATLVYGVARFVASGGSLHVRYVAPVIPCLAVAVAMGLGPRRGRPWAIAAAVAAMALMQVAILRRWRNVMTITKIGIGLPVESWAVGVSRALLVAWGLGVAGALVLLLGLRTPSRSEVEGGDLGVGERPGG